MRMGSCFSFITPSSRWQCHTSLPGRAAYTGMPSDVPAFSRVGELLVPTDLLLARPDTMTGRATLLKTASMQTVCRQVGEPCVD